MMFCVQLNYMMPGFISEEKLNIDLNASNNKIITY